MLIGTCIKENAAKPSTVGIHLITDFQDINDGLMNVKISNNSLLYTEPDEIKGGKKYPAFSAASRLIPKQCRVM
jgi:hypothetical protein